MIRVENLGKTYAGDWVVDVEALELPRGGLTAIIGPNGAGKSTLLSMISRLQTPDRGHVTLDGQDILRIKGDVLARQLTVLRQDNAMTARLTVADLVAFGRYPYSKGRLTEADRAEIERALALVDIAPYRHRFLDELSGGQRQRAFIAMVLAQDTEYAFFDEPLNSLDIRHAVSVMHLLRRAAEDLGKTVVTVLHDLNFAARHADRIIAMKNGRLQVVGRPDEVIRPAILRDLYGLDLDVTVRQGKPLVDVFG